MKERFCSYPPLESFKLLQVETNLGNMGFFIRVCKDQFREWIALKIRKKGIFRPLSGYNYIQVIKRSSSRPCFNSTPIKRLGVRQV